MKKVFLLILMMSFVFLGYSQDTESQSVKAKVFSSHIQGGFSAPYGEDITDGKGIGFSIDAMLTPRVLKNQLSFGIVYDGNNWFNKNEKFWEHEIKGKDSHMSYAAIKMRYDIGVNSNIRPYIALAFGKAFYKKHSIAQGKILGSCDLNVGEEDMNEYTDGDYHFKTLLHYNGGGFTDAVTSYDDKSDRCALKVEGGISFNRYTLGVSYLIPKHFFASPGQDVFAMQINVGIRIPLL